MVDGTGTTTYTYDEMDRLLSVVSPGSVTVGYRYDIGSNRTKIIYPDATAVTYTFDKANRLSTVVDWASRTTSYQYNADDSVAVVSYNNNTSANHQYDNAGRLTQVWNKYRTDDTVSRNTYTLDGVGNRLVDDMVLADVVDSPGPIDPDHQGTVTYVYDKMYRVTKETRILPSPQRRDVWDHTYDSVGNRLSKKRTDYDWPYTVDETLYAYDKADRITGITGDESETIVTNANGNITSRGGDPLTYDQEDRLKTSDLGAYHYIYVYDGDGKLKKLRRGTISIIDVEVNIYDVNRGLPVVLKDDAGKYVWGLTALYSVDNTFNEEHVYHYDGLGSVVAMTGEDDGYPTFKPDIDEYEAYTAFGEKGYSNRGEDQPFYFTGEYEDEATGYLYLRSRHYDAKIARLISRDTLFGNPERPLTLNRYSYVENNPVNAVDPTGHSATKATSSRKPSILYWQILGGSLRAGGGISTSIIGGGILYAATPATAGVSAAAGTALFSVGWLEFGAGVAEVVDGFKGVSNSPPTPTGAVVTGFTNNQNIIDAANAVHPLLFWTPNIGGSLGLLGNLGNLGDAWGNIEMAKKKWTNTR